VDEAGVDLSIGPLELVRTLSWPGGGVQLLVMPSPSKLDLPEWGEPHLLRADGSELAIERAALTETSGITALLITPAADTDAHAAQLEAARALIAALPAGERFGVWLGSGQLPLLCELTEQREHVLARLAAIAPQAPEPIDALALENLQRRLSKVEGPYGAAARTLIGVGMPDVAAAVGSKLVHLLRFGPAPDADAFGWSDAVSPAAAAQELASALLRTREQAFRVGACDVATDERLVLALAEQRIATSVPAELTGSTAGCDAGAAARDEYPFPDAVSLEMDDAQLAEHERLAAAKDESDFTLSFAFGDAAPIPARAHFRGQTSLECARKNYSIHFSDNEARRLLPRAHANEFMLLSMCWDKGWFRQVLANRIMRDLGLFPLEQRYVKLRVAGREQGVYLLLEKPDESLRSQKSNLAGLVRRRYDPGDQPPESQWPKPERDPERATQNIDAYLAVVALIDTTPPDALAKALSARLDLDQYLRWLSVMTYFQSGDYADEVFFYASEEAAADGGWYFRTMGWDADDLFVSCHHNGKYMIPDPHGLLFCLEGNLDRALFVAPDIYTRFATGLLSLIEGPLATTEVFGKLDALHAELLGLLQDDAVCAGTGLVLDEEPATCAALHPWLDGIITDFQSKVRARSNGLAERARTYLAAP
jgi:hypothetical protein